MAVLLGRDISVGVTLAKLASTVTRFHWHEFSRLLYQLISIFRFRDWKIASLSNTWFSLFNYYSLSSFPRARICHPRTTRGRGVDSVGGRKPRAERARQGGAGRDCGSATPSLSFVPGPSSHPGPPRQAYNPTHPPPVATASFFPPLLGLLLSSPLSLSSSVTRFPFIFLNFLLFFSLSRVFYSFPSRRVFMWSVSAFLVNVSVCFCILLFCFLFFC